MTARIVSAEEARGLLAPLEPGETWTYHRGTDPELDPRRAERPWVETVPSGAPDDGGDIVALFYRWDDGRGRLAATAPDLARTVIALEGERDAALARVARLERVLAVERGDASRAPAGWVGTPAGIGWDRGEARVWRLTVGRWRWRIGYGEIRDAATALEAMEAADAAGEVTT